MRTCGVTLPVHTGHVHGNTHMLSHTGLPTTQAVSPRAFVPHLSLLSLPYRAGVRSKPQSGAAGRPEVPAPRTTLGLFWQRRGTGGPSTSPGLSGGRASQCGDVVCGGSAGRWQCRTGDQGCGPGERLAAGRGFLPGITALRLHPRWVQLRLPRLT